MSVQDKWLCAKEAAKEIGHDPRTLYRWRKEQKGPPAYEFGYKNIRYKKSDLESWLESRNTQKFALNVR